MAYWLFKTEPNEFSIDDLQALGDKAESWYGIRNYQARNLLRDQVRCGDKVFIYHSSCKLVGIAGIAEVVRTAYADPAQFDPNNPYFDPKSPTENPRWVCVDIKFVEKFPRIIGLSEIKALPHLAEMALVKKGRLSIQPVTKSEWQILTKMALE